MPLEFDDLVPALCNNVAPGFRHLLDYNGMAREFEQTAGSVETAAYPRLFQVETTTRCGLSCPFCPRTFSLRKTGVRPLNADMDFNLFRELLDQMPWLRSVELFGFGEPFLHGELPRFIRHCAERRILTVVASSLSIVHREVLADSLAAGLDYLLVDLDSLNEREYLAIRPGADFRRTLDALRLVLLRPRRPYVTVQAVMVKGRPAYTEQELSHVLGDKLRPDALAFKFVDSFRGQACPKGKLGPHDVCREAFYGFTVQVNGDVVPCDRDWAGEAVMGNILEDSVQAIWQGERFKAFRAAARSAEKPDLCRNCAEGRLFNYRSQPHIQVNMTLGAEITA
jgi:radical SAM protein with 4Fe4S-binding SPASM domain